MFEFPSSAIGVASAGGGESIASYLRRAHDEGDAGQLLTRLSGGRVAHTSSAEVRDALLDFQRAEGLAETGELDAPTRKVLETRVAFVEAQREEAAAGEGYSFSLDELDHWGEPGVEPGVEEGYSFSLKEVDHWDAIHGAEPAPYVFTLKELDAEVAADAERLLPAEAQEILDSVGGAVEAWLQQRA